MHPGIAARMARQSGLVTRREALEVGLAAEQVDRLVRSGRWTIVRRGVYAETELVTSLSTVRERRLLIDRAASLRIGPAHVMSHDSAAYLLDLSILRAAEPCTHVTRPRVVGSHLRHGVKHHLAPYADDQLVQVDDRPVLGPARTALDVAREHGNPAGVVAVDAARRCGVSTSSLWDVESRMRSWPRVTTAREAIALSDPDADSPGETLLRLLVTELGFGRPSTQLGLTDGSLTAWCDLRLGRHVFEFDGRTKYRRTDEGGVSLMSAEEVLWLEKQRQDWVCGFKLGMSRVVWSELLGPARRDTVARLRREYLDTCTRFGTSIDDLAPYLVRRRRPRPAPRVA